MDSRTNTSHSAFSRPLSQPALRDPRHAPIPPPPYTLQTPVRTAHHLNHDPFLQRRNDYEESWQEQSKPTSQAAFSLGTYPASAPRDALTTATENRERVQENWRFADGRMDRYRSQSGDAPRSETTETPLQVAAFPPLTPPLNFVFAEKEKKKVADAQLKLSGSSHSSLLPPPPSSSSLAFATTTQDPATQQREPARHQEHRTSSPRMYGGTQEIPPPPPPPPPVIGRPMLPPSPQYNARPPMSQVPPPPPPFAGRRELPAPSSSTRPGSSMSILSMLDSGPPPRTSREPTTSTPLNGTSPPSSYSVTQPLPASSPTKSTQGNGFLHRSSPDKFRTSQAPTNRPFRAYSGGTSQRPYSSIKAGSPDNSRYGTVAATPLSQYSPHSESNAQPEVRQQQDRRSSISGLMDRPNSQPNGYGESPSERKSRSEIDALRADMARRELNPPQHRVTSFEFLSRDAQLERQARLEQQAQVERQAEMERQQRLEQEKQSAANDSPRDDRLRNMDYPFLTHTSVFSEPPSSGLRPERESPASQALNRSIHSQSQPQYSPTKGPLSEDSLRRLREERQKSTQQPTGYSPSASRNRFFDNGTERQPPLTHNAGSREGNSSVNGGFQPNRTPDDGSQNHRNMLATMFDTTKRGRISPLPQAVQGAQGQIRGPSTDPNIKNEFSRLFPGIGSGVGSTGISSGASTPFPPPSPKPNHESDNRVPFGSRREIADLGRSSRDTSRVGKRSRRVKDDDELEILESRPTNVPTSTRGVRKSRHGHHHHRHHHHHVDEQNGTSSHHHHLHHHYHPDGTKHHHIHSKASNPHQKSPVRIPSTTIKNNQILESVRNLPRHHLGSVVYSPGLEPPTSKASIGSRLAYTTAPYIIPPCEGKENHTLTVRIPKFYLSRKHREQVCLGAAVWGIEIYSDDSDPLAAAIHSGWIRGNWGDIADFTMLELNPTAESKDTTTEHQPTLSAPPPVPILPPPGKDLHLTLLILPPLQQYPSRINHGIKSRAWGNDHDGMSFRIEKIAWVEERGERGVEARRKRLKMMTGGKGGGGFVKVGFGMGRGVGEGKVGTVAA